MQFKAPKPTRWQRIEHYTVDGIMVCALLAVTWLITLGLPPALLN